MGKSNHPTSYVFLLPAVATQHQNNDNHTSETPTPVSANVSHPSSTTSNIQWYAQDVYKAVTYLSNLILCMNSNAREELRNDQVEYNFQGTNESYASIAAVDVILTPQHEIPDHTEGLTGSYSVKIGIGINNLHRIAYYCSEHMGRTLWRRDMKKLTEQHVTDLLYGRPIQDIEVSLGTNVVAKREWYDGSEEESCDYTADQIRQDTLNTDIRKYIDKMNYEIETRNLDLKYGQTSALQRQPTCVRIVYVLANDLWNTNIPADYYTEIGKLFGSDVSMSEPGVTYYLKDEVGFTLRFTKLTWNQIVKIHWGKLVGQRPVARVDTIVQGKVVSSHKYTEDVNYFSANPR